MDETNRITPLDGDGASHPPRLTGMTVHELIGRGAHGEVWRATRYAAEPTEVAVKVLHERGPANRSEWRSMRENAGPHVVPVLDLLTDADGRACLVMPLYAGGTLETIVRGRGGLTVGETITALAPIASALAAVHERSLVHGDVSPENVLLDADGRPSLADLGAVQVIARGEAATWGRTGYVAPEVLDGEAPTSAADVYAFGCSLWFCCTAQVPQVAALRPRLDDLVPDLPPSFVELVTTCLSQTPSARPHAHEVAARLLTAGAARPVPIAVGTPATSSTDGLTRRLRADAQSRQNVAKPEAGRPRSGARPTQGALPWGRRALSWAGSVGLAIVGISSAMLWPLGAGSGATPAMGRTTAGPPPSALHQAARGGQGARTAASPRAVHSTAGPDTGIPAAADVQALLDCRAAAWNAVDADLLRPCLAAGSAAERQDREALRKAGERHVSYASIAYDLARSSRAVGPDARGHVILDTLVTTQAYDVFDATGRRHVGPRSETVRLEMSRTSAGWRIEGWNVS